jgi:hypothetical protein
LTTRTRSRWLLWLSPALITLTLLSGCSKDVLSPQTKLTETPLVDAASEVAEAAIESPSLPIMAWIGVPQSQTTLPRYQEMSEAGFNYSFSLFSDINAMQAALDVAELTGVKMFVSCPELLADPETTVRRFMGHPALAGYYLSDEPAAEQFPRFGNIAKRIQSIDDAHPCYINLLPNFAEDSQLGVQGYSAYLDEFIRQVPTQLLSFDNYPIIGNTSLSIRPGWYNNLEVFSKKAKLVNKPFWAFALAVAHSPYPVATLAALRLQVYSDLAYGAQGIQYFTYWTLNDPGGYDFHNAPITLDGQRTDVYEKVKAMNKEIKSLSGVFLGSKVISVGHTGKTIPAGTSPLTVLPPSIAELKTEGLGAVVSVLENGSFSYLVVVNRDFTATMPLTLRCQTGVRRVLKDGSSVNMDTKSHTLVLEPGDAAILRWTTAK